MMTVFRFRLAIVSVVAVVAWSMLTDLSVDQPTGAITQPSAIQPSSRSAPAECPGWAQERVPAWIEPFLGRFGLPDP